MNVRIDEGELAGGFARAYDARITTEAVTPVQRSIAVAAGIGQDNTVCVSVAPDGGAAWSCCFPQPRNGSEPCVFTTPNPHVVGVRADFVYAFDVSGPDEPIDLGDDAITCVAFDVHGGRMFLGGRFEVTAFDGRRVLWRSRQVSLDYISGLSYADGIVHGIATDIDGEAVEFTIDARTGEAQGGLEIQP